MMLKKTLLSLNRKIAKRQSANRGVLVISAPVPERNRGDQALLDVVVKTLKQRGVERIGIATTSSHLLTSFSTNDGLNIHTDFYYAFMTKRSFQEQIRFQNTVAMYKHMVVIGADVLDEGYSVARSEATMAMIDEANALGVSTRIFGFSVNGSPSPALQQRLSTIGKNTRLFVRDPVSYRRLESAKIAGIEEAGDLAYLLEPSNELPNTELRNFVEHDTKKIIGLNLTQVVLGAYGHEKERLELLAEACRRLHREDDYRFLLIPHDEPEGVSYLKEFQQRLQSQTIAFSHLVSPVPHCRELKRIAGLCKHLFTCRLHLGIAALGMNTPVTGFPYQGKFEGQFQLFGLGSESFIDAASFPTNADDMYHLMRRRIEQSDDLRLAIQCKLPEVHELSQRNFDGLS